MPSTASHWPVSIAFSRWTPTCAIPRSRASMWVSVSARRLPSLLVPWYTYCAPPPTRFYTDSPIWLRQQQEALKNSQLLPKCGVLSPCVNNINQTVAAAVAVTTDIERDMWNIVEASSGAELGEISYEFPVTKPESDHDSSVSVSAPATAQPAAATQSERGDSVYSYDNHNYSTGPEDGISLPDDLEEDVFGPPPPPNSNFQGVDPVELRRSLACVMRQKLRSDDTDYYSQQQVVPAERELSHEQAEQELPRERELRLCSTHTSPTNGSLPQQLRSKLLGVNSSSDHCLPLPGAPAPASAPGTVYVIDGSANPLSPVGHKPKYRKSAALTRNSRKKSRSCSCSCSSEQKLTSAVEPTAITIIPTEQQRNSPSCNSSNNRHSVPHEHFFSPLKTVGNFMQHSNLFNLFQPHATGAATTSESIVTLPPAPPPAPPAPSPAAGGTPSRLAVGPLTSFSGSSSSSLVAASDAS